MNKKYMGIKNLNKLLLEKNIIKYHKSYKSLINNKKNITIGIDTNLYYYKFIKSKLKNPFYGFLLQIKNFLKFNITPLYILDGKCPKEKQYLIDKRKNNKNNVFIPYQDIKDFFKLLNIQYVQSNIEADKCIGLLYQKKIINYCLTDDLDILLHQCDNIISIKKGIIYEYNLKYILTSLNLNRKKFVTMCILLGCDYIKPKLLVSYKEIYELILEEKDLSNIQKILLYKYKNQKNKINYIFSILNTTYDLFSINNIDSDSYKMMKNNRCVKFQQIIKEMININNELIKCLPYSLLMTIYKSNMNLT